jgi:predicted ATPase/class 3 adenylate cyclase
MQEFPTGTVTLLFGDIERSTALLQELGPERYGATLAEYRKLMRDAIDLHGGVEVDTEGDGFFAAFPSARQAIAGAREAQAALTDTRLRVRMGLHTGEPLVIEGEYTGIDVHRAARVADAGHGGQILLSQSTRDLIGPTEQVRDLGRHRLKDLGEPIPVYQLGAKSFPPLRSLNSTNLPIQPTPLIGRERELQEGGRLLRAHRLVTLTGPGGSGKTRLALQLAADAADDFPEGVVWVPLQSVREPELVLPAISLAMGTSGTLGESGRERRVLVVLDNVEQVLAASSQIADLVSQLPQAKLLITSREPLHIAAEREYPVVPLREPDAVALFVERATAVKPDFSDDDDDVMEICRRLDCLPLALELAAARLKALSAKELLRRLDRRLPILTGGPRDAPERHRTLRATIAWSHELLSADERRAFARLAVFAGGCTLEAAEEVCDADLEIVAALIDKSLLRREEDRYYMLETIGEYALEQLEESGESEEVRGRHAEYYLEQARSVERLIRSPQAAGALDRLEQDHGNLRVALDWLSTETADRPLRLAMWGLAARLHGFGDQALDRENFGEAARLYRESLEIGLPLRDEMQTAYCLAGLAAVGAQRGRLRQAARLWGSVTAFERTAGTPLHDSERQRYERVLGELELGPDTSADFAGGRSMTLEQGVQYALASME